MVLKTSKPEMQANLERQILHGLSCEWEQARLSLALPLRCHLKKPLFRLDALKTQLGAWNKSKNEIMINRYLALNYAWKKVRDVLLHEMAHQLADRLLNGKIENPHGPLFQKACRLLRTEPIASEKIQLASDGELRQSRHPRDRLLQRVKKLIALAGSANVHEARAAMAKAHHLIAKYNIDIIQQNKPRNFVSAVVGKPALRHTRDEYYLAQLLQSYYFVEGIWIPMYVVAKGRMGRILELNGTPKNVEIAAYVYDAVRTYTQNQWHRYKQDKTLSYNRKIDFAVGVIEGFQQKLANTAHGPISRSKERTLLVVTDSSLKKYLKERYPHTRLFKRHSSRYDPKVIQDGQTIGKSMVISEAIRNQPSNRMKKLLG